VIEHTTTYQPTQAFKVMREFFQTNERSSRRRWFPWRLLSWAKGGRGSGRSGGRDLRDPAEPVATEKSDARPRIGLALSSGGAKGLAHIGVIQVLEEHGIKIDAVAGASMGAYVGAMWCAGQDGKQLQALAAEMETSKDLLDLVDPVLPPRRGFIRGTKIEERLRSTLGDITFEELVRPLSVVATELDGYRRVIFETGDLASAVRASLSIPGILTPMVRDGVEYMDGGVCDPLPVGVLRRKDVDVVIAVSVIPSLQELPEEGREPLDRIDLERRSWWRRCLSWLNHRANYFAKGNLFDILRGAAFGSQLRLAEASAEKADVLIRPVTTHCRWHDYTAWREYIEVGRRAAEEALPEIRAQLALAAAAKKSEHHSPPPSPQPLPKPDGELETVY